MSISTTNQEEELNTLDLNVVMVIRGDAFECLDWRWLLDLLDDHSEGLHPLLDGSEGLEGEARDLASHVATEEVRDGGGCQKCGTKLQASRLQRAQVQQTTDLLRWRENIQNVKHEKITLLINSNQHYYIAQIVLT